MCGGSTKFGTDTFDLFDRKRVVSVQPASGVRCWNSEPKQAGELDDEGPVLDQRRVALFIGG